MTDAEMILLARHTILHTAGGEDSDLPDEMANRMEALIAERARLREALEPFAAMADAPDISGDGDNATMLYVDGLKVTVGDLRRARESLK